MKLTVVLPYPDAGLSPNARLFFRRKAVLARDAHEIGFVSVVALGPEVRVMFNKWQGRIPVRLTFSAPDKRGRDMDNAYASCKNMIDGVAAALGVNDKRFWPVTLTWGDTAKPGKVVLEIDA